MDQPLGHGFKFWHFHIFIWLKPNELINITFIGFNMRFHNKYVRLIPILSSGQMYYATLKGMSDYDKYT